MCTTITSWSHPGLSEVSMRHSLGVNHDCLGLAPITPSALVYKSSHLEYHFISVIPGLPFMSALDIF